MQINSPAFEFGQPIPSKFTCEGQNVSPPLAIEEIPEGAKSLALIMEDPDAPHGTFTHWIAWNIDPQKRIIEEGKKLGCEGKNSFGKIGYGGPCPPPGSLHRYYFRLYALRKELTLPPGSQLEELKKEIKKELINQTEWMGTYSRGE